MKLNNQNKHVLGMIDDTTADDSSFESMVDEFALGRNQNTRVVESILLRRNLEPELKG